MANTNRPRETYRERTKKLIDKYYDIAESMLTKAKEIADSGEDIRSTKERPGVPTYMHSAQRAVDDIVRLWPLAMETEAKLASENLPFDGFDFSLPKHDETLRDN